MYLRVMGAMLIISGCSALGLCIGAAFRREILLLQGLLSAMEEIICELQYHLTPLPQLLRKQADRQKGELGAFFLDFSCELEAQIAPEAAYCAASALDRHGSLPQSIQKSLLSLGNSLGRFDLQGQLQCLESVRYECNRTLETALAKQPGHLRCCQAYCICAGVVITLLLL